MSYYYPGGHRVIYPDTVYFVTIRVIDWVDVFTREEYKYIITDSLDYCRRSKGLYLYAWVLMTNHLHLIVSHEIDNDHLWKVLGDFKKFTSKRVIDAIINNSQESRIRWLLPHFGEQNIMNNSDASCSVSKQNNYDVRVTNPHGLEGIVVDNVRVCNPHGLERGYGLTGGHRRGHYHLWQRGIDRYCISNIKHLRQKMDYLHANPVRAGIVNEPYNYRFSSSPNYCGEKGVIDIDMIDLGISDPTKYNNH